MPHSWTLGQLFERRVQEHAGRTSVVCGGRTRTYAQIDAASAALAAALAELGVGEHDRVALNLPNCEEWGISLLAIARLGATVVPVNPALSYHELKYQFRHAEISAVITAEQYEGADFLALFERLIVELPDLQYVVTVGTEDLWYDDRIFQFEDLLSSGAGRPVPVPRACDDDADLALLYTSGTMGKPKGVRLSHRAIVETAVRTADAVEVEPGDRVFAAVPLFTMFGFSIAVGTMACGAALVLQERFAAATALELIERQRVTVVHGVPAMYHMLMREPTFDPSKLVRLRSGIVAGGPVPEQLVRRIRTWCDVQVAYGLTETGPTVAVTRFTDTDDKRSTTVGRPSRASR